MSLTILATKLHSREEVLTSILFSVLKAKLHCIINSSALKSNGAIQDIDVRRYFGNKEDDYEYFLIDVHEKEWSINIFNQGTFTKNGIPYFLLAGTDNTPSKLCYDFSLEYLRLCPEQRISIYNWVFSLEDIERLATDIGWYETWYQNFTKLDKQI